MSEDNKILNRGLDALLGGGGSNQRTVKDINVSNINAGRFQPCGDEEASAEQLCGNDLPQAAEAAAHVYCGCYIDNYGSLK